LAKLARIDITPACGQQPQTKRCFSRVPGALRKEILGKFVNRSAEIFHAHDALRLGTLEIDIGAFHQSRGRRTIASPAFQLLDQLAGARGRPFAKLRCATAIDRKMYPRMTAVSGVHSCVAEEITHRPRLGETIYFSILSHLGIVRAHGSITSRAKAYADELFFWCIPLCFVACLSGPPTRKNSVGIPLPIGMVYLYNITLAPARAK
jgi:hypothetical protein